MNIEEFRAELETRLNIEKEYILQELSSVVDEREKFEFLGKFNEKYKELIKKMAQEEGIDLLEMFPHEDSNDSKLNYEQVILGKTMSIYDKLVDELYEKVAH